MRVMLEIPVDIYAAIKDAAAQRDLSPEAWISYVFPDLLASLLHKPVPNDWNDQDNLSENDRCFLEGWNNLSVWEQQGVHNPLEPAENLSLDETRAEVRHLLSGWLPDSLSQEEVLNLALSADIEESSIEA
ncbi:MAG: hypothetical protein HC884_14065 [Chloroflexaceae bacterium]|nr:hypothetical protein [Chloroflexaceae bacterium]